MKSLQKQTKTTKSDTDQVAHLGESLSDPLFDYARVESTATYLSPSFPQSASVQKFQFVPENWKSAMKDLQKRTKVTKSAPHQGTGLGAVLAAPLSDALGHAGAAHAGVSGASSFPQFASVRTSIQKLLFFPLLITGCMVGPNYRTPQVSVPQSYRQQLSVVTNQPSQDLSQWWQVFHDPQLDALIQEATLANLDVRLAGARVREARAQSGVTRSALFPSVDANGQYLRQRASQNTPDGFLAHASGQSYVQNFFDTGLDMNWEIDVFGGNRRALEAANAELGSTVESGRGVLITVIGDVGLNYLDLRGLQKQLAVARDNLRLQEQTLDLTRDQFKAGLASELDTTRAEAQVANTRSLIPLLEQDIQRSIHRLSILIGKQPAELEAQLVTPAAIPPAVPGIPVGLPSDLLRRRPDIRQAEREVAAATAQVGVATADLFPKFFLTGAAGLQSLNASDFFDAGSRFWSLGPSVQWPIFTAGRIRQNIKVQNARQEQALIRYEQTVLTSLEEVENALVACGKEQEHYQDIVQSESANRRAVELADQRYRSGLVDFLNVLETQRSLLAVQDDLARSERTMDQNLVRLYKALGGGWEGQTQVAELKPNTH
jgi:NodT family efflux transporter outer membrane factor (OMF) lipoprotein